MNKILACIDGSAYAASVCDHAAWAARRASAALHLLHALDAHREHADHADLSGNIGPGTNASLLAELTALEETQNRLARERGKALLAEAARRLAASGVASVTTEQLHGELVETVTRLEATADLVVLGKRGEHADFAKLHLGSNLERVVRASIRPVLVASRKFEPIEQFLVAHDGGASIGKAIAFATENPLLRGLKCQLLHAGRIDSAAERSLAEATETLRAAGYEVSARAEPGEPETVLANALSSHGAQLLVMGAYGHSRIRQLLVGSTTTTMIRTCKIPVLLFR
jgi:nucleotide-binding universal stress UspA family protein